MIGFVTIEIHTFSQDDIAPLLRKIENDARVLSVVAVSDPA